MWEIVVGVCAGLCALSYGLICWDRRVIHKHRTLLLTRSPDEYQIITTTRGVKLFVRWTKSTSATKSSSSRRSIVIPNGLAATMATIGAIHSALVAQGYDVLSYDREGVGLSCWNNTVPSQKATAEDCIQDLYDIMQSVNPGCTDWIMVGPSMGSIVAQCFLMKFGSMVKGFVNVDGLPHSFYLVRDKFEKAGKFYKVASVMCYAGFLRPFLLFARKLFALIATHDFPVTILAAQMNLPQFWSSTGREMYLMMDLAKYASNGWGEIACHALPVTIAETLANTRPEANGRYDVGTASWVQLPRSAAEVGVDWVDGAAVVQHLKSNRMSCVLGRVFSELRVSVLAARQYNYAGGDKFYTKDMKMWAAAEQTLHVAVAQDGKRFVLPEVGHDKLFLEVDAIKYCVQYVA